VQLSDVIGRLNSQNPDETLFTNAAAIKNVALIRKQTSDIFFLASGRRKGILNWPEIVEPGTPAGAALESLADAFDKAAIEMDQWAQKKFKPHLRAAKGVRRIVGVDDSGLEDDLAPLAAIAASITEADNRFNSEWTRILEKRTDGLQAYSTVLKDHWLKDGWDMSPDFSGKHMDESTVLYVEQLMKELGRQWARDAIERSANGPPYNLRSVEAQLKDVIADLTLPLTKDDLRNVNLPTSSMTAWSEIKRELQTDARSLPFRVCCFGSVKHGKSSFINALIGKIVLEPGSKCSRAQQLLRRLTILQSSPRHLGLCWSSIPPDCRSRSLRSMPTTLRHTLDFWERPNLLKT